MSISDLFQFHFMTNALIAGTLVAITASSIGWFMVVRRQTFAGLTDAQVLTLFAISAAAVLVLGLIARPLLFASVDADVARASGVPVAALSTGFLLLLGLAVAATSQITGALLVFALLVTPAATAQLITPRPGLSLALSVAIGLAVTWAGLAIAYFSIYPVGFYVTSLSFGLYVLVRVGRALVRRRRTPARLTLEAA